MSENKRKNPYKEQMKEYLATIKTTPQERSALRRWLREGNSPQENPWGLSWQRGDPVDYVRAKRIVDQWKKEEEEWWILEGCAVQETQEEDLQEEDLPF